MKGDVVSIKGCSVSVTLNQGRTHGRGGGWGGEVSPPNFFLSYFLESETSAPGLTFSVSVRLTLPHILSQVFSDGQCLWLRDTT